MNKFLALALALLTSITAVAGPVGAPNTVYRMSASGLRPAFGQVNIASSSAVTGALLVTNGGTGQTSWTLGDIPYSSATNTVSKLAGNTTATKKFLTQTGTGSVSAAPAWSAPTAPTIQAFTSTGTTTGYRFTVTSANATVGATYTNNAQTFTVLATISGSTTLFTSSGGAPAASGTLTKSAGTGDATITFSTSAALATYTPPAGVTWIRVRLIGGGGGGGSNSAAGTTGIATVFGSALLTGNGGVGATSAGGSGNGGVGGSASVTTSGTVLQLAALTGGQGGGASGSASGGATALFPVGGQGGNGPFGGGGGGGTGGSAGQNAAANTGAGGGAGGGSTSTSGGAGGGAGGYLEAIITSLAATYPYGVGTGGAGASSGLSNGGNGGSGIIIVEEHYQ